jgi:pimeloyl-ACP methyl ester carboxylesterase
MKYISVTLIILTLTVSLHAMAKKTVSFPSLDEVKITADLYGNSDDRAPLIILFHQAGWSRGEYVEIAPKLLKLGFNCLAVDLRSGGEINGILNKTKIEAVKEKRGTYFLDAYKDMAASLLYAKAQLKPKKIIIWGSSYSSALAFKLAADFSFAVDAILAFSPGEYFVTKKRVKLKNYILNYALLIHQPIFITSAKDEIGLWKKLYNSVPGSKKHKFLPTDSKGNHGSRALWKKWPDNKAYWQAVTTFLQKGI